MTVSGVSPMNLLSGGRTHWRHLANTVDRLPPGVAMWSVLKLLWTILFFIYTGESYLHRITSNACLLLTAAYENRVCAGRPTVYMYLHI